MTWGYVAMVVAAAAMATAGLLLDSPAAVIGSMCVAPFLAAVAFGRSAPSSRPRTSPRICMALARRRDLRRPGSCGGCREPGEVSEVSELSELLEHFALGRCIGVSPMRYADMTGWGPQNSECNPAG